MSSSSLLRVALAGVACCVATLATFAASPWPIAADGLTPDPTYQWGRLPNGLRYAVRENALPAGRVSYRLAVEVGSAHEQPKERGFAHLVEHMAFNGTKRHPGDKLQHELGQRGLAFGPEVSAFTFPSYTIYQFDSPGNSADDIAWMLAMLRDFADGLTFESRELKRELGVVTAELRERQSPSTRFDTARRREFYPHSPIANPLYAQPENVKPDILRRFYQQWYRPERMILCVVGDAPAAELEAAVQRAFASLAAVGPAPTWSPGLIENPPPGTPAVFHDHEGGGLFLELASVLPTRPDSLTERRRQLAANLAVQALTDRLNELTRQHPKEYAMAGARVQPATPFATESSIYLSCTSEVWEKALVLLNDELRRSLEFTFYPGELEIARQRVLRSAEHAVNSSRTAESDQLANNLIQAALWGQTLLSPEDQAALLREMLPQIEPREVSGAWRSFWQAGRTRVFGYGFFPVPGAPEFFARTLEEAGRRTIERAPEPRPVEFPYTDFGAPGEVLRRRHIADVDLHLFEFANGVRVALKRTTFTANHVDLGVSFGSGLRAAGRTEGSLPPLLSAMFLNGGLGKLPPADLTRVLAAEPLSLNFNANEESFSFAGSATPARLERLCQLVCAYLTDPRWDADARSAAITQLIGSFGDAVKNAEGILRLTSFHEATFQDSRYRLPSPDELNGTSLPQVRDWFLPTLKEAPLELALVGDFSPEEVIPVLARTFGALPPRAQDPVAPIAVKFRKAPGEFAFPAPPFSGRAAIQIIWPADQGVKIEGSRRLEALAAVLNNRIFRRVREDLGASYSPSAIYWHTETGSKEGYLSAFVTTDPKQTAKVRRLLLAEAESLATKGATPTEFAEALRPLQQRTRLELSGNSYWLWNIAIDAHRHPEVVQYPLTRSSDFQQMTLEEINALARAVLPKARALHFTAEPAR